jgi:hypothetical protein
MSKGSMPPVPPEGRNAAGGDHGGKDHSDVPHADKRDSNPDKQGRQANTKQNTTHQGYQQDR